MPIRRIAGSSIEDLERELEQIEKRERVLQIVGQYGAGWAVLTEKRPARPTKETR